jgi:hypothetical protein
MPILMLCAGTGLAPFRDFFQQRAIQMRAGRKLARAVLFVGCRSETKDRLHAEEIDEWVEQGVGGCQVRLQSREGQVKWMCVCARDDDQGGGGDCEYVEGWCEVLCVQDEEAGRWDRRGGEKDCGRGGQQEILRSGSRT